MPDTCTSIINLRYPAGSIGSATNPERFEKEQDFDSLKNLYVQRGRLFVDKTFPPNNYSLGNLEALTASNQRQVKWYRPKDFLNVQRVNSAPLFTVDGISRFDFGQGYIGNCWFLAAISSLTMNKKLLAQVVPDQSFDNYAGIFHFRFWRFGKWVDVVIDDYLPTVRNEFLSVHSKTTNEFWVPLLEKAYAKVCGSYGDMSAGLTSEACKDLTGGLSLSFPLQQVHDRDHDKQMWAALINGSDCQSMMCCGTPSVNSGAIVNTINNNGLVNAHAYSVTRVTEVWHRGSKVKLVRLLNPWGKQEWNGNWSDSSKLWNQVSQEDQAKRDKDENGEFWMELEDFCHNYCMLSICCENPNFMDGDLSCQWQLMIHEGVWNTTGGNLNFSTFYTNPQFRVKVDIRNEEEECDMNCFVTLMQKPSERNRNKARYVPITINIFPVPPGTSDGRLGSSFFRQIPPMKRQIIYSEEREVTDWFSLTPGEYLIVPSTMHQYMRAEFVLSIYTKSNMKINPYEGEDDHAHDMEEDNHILPESPTDNEDSSAKDIFDHYAGLEKELDARKLQKLLNDHFARGRNIFGLDTCMNFISLKNTDSHTLMMNFEEFSDFWNKLQKYMQLFEIADSNRNGVLSHDELNTAVRAAGIPASDGWVKVAMFRFSFGASSMTLQSFLALMIRLDHMTAFFNSNSSNGILKMSFDDLFGNTALF